MTPKYIFSKAAMSSGYTEQLLPGGCESDLVCDQRFKSEWPQERILEFLFKLQNWMGSSAIVGCINQLGPVKC